MTERQVTKEVCQVLRSNLERSAHRSPNSPIFEKQFACGPETYTLFLMLAKDRVYTLYALRAFRQSDGSTGYQTVSNPNVLAGLTHILILQSTTGRGGGTGNTNNSDSATDVSGAERICGGDWNN